MKNEDLYIQLNYTEHVSEFGQQEDLKLTDPYATKKASPVRVSKKKTSQ